MIPAVLGLPCPAAIPPVVLSAAETTRLVRLTREYAAGRPTRARLALHYHWSGWRRHHQAGARWHHYAARPAPLAT